MHTQNNPTIDIEKYLKEHENKQLLRFITCGSVDDGKSTLIGRLLHDSKMIFEDQLSAIEKDSKKHGTTGEKIDLALLVDGLQSEREQGITIDVAYRYFSTEKKKYIIADTPGHEQYTRNMATGASTADVAIILIDARSGVLTQTKRHSYIVSLLGIRHIIIAINKMDLVGYSQDRFEEIKAQYQDEVLLKLPTNTNSLLSVEYIPISALEGDNVVNKSSKMDWFKSPSLMEYLDNLNLNRELDSNELRFPVQYVNRPNLNFRGYCGTVVSGEIGVNDDITVLPSGKSTRVKEIYAPSANKEIKLNSASSYSAITITVTDEIDISRGDMIVHTSSIPRLSNSLKVMIIWMDEEKMLPKTNYLIKTSTSLIGGHFEHINYKFDINTFEKLKVNELHLNDIASCKLVLNSSIVADTYKKNRATGSFIVIDKITNKTVGAGMIIDVSRREQDEIQQTDREYSQAEIELNAYIRKYYPEWGCKAI